MARPGLDRNAKFKVLIRRLGIAKPFVRGLLETLWDVAHECGNPVIGDEGAVEAAAEWPNKPGELFAALREGNWIDELPGGRWQIHDYYDHAPEYARKRMDRESARTAAGKTLSEVRSEAAKRRWEKDANGSHLHPLGMQTDANVMQTAANGTPPTPTPTPTPKKGVSPPSTPSRAKPAEVPRGFDRFWKAYPRKKAKPKAQAAWAKLSPDPALETAIHTALARQTGCDQWTRDGGKYIPHPATWLNGRRWEDEADPAGDLESLKAAAFGNDDPPTEAELEERFPDLFKPNQAANGQPTEGVSC